jgi:hypothetical protein
MFNALQTIDEILHAETMGEVSKITKPYSTLRVDYITDFGGVISKETPVQFVN